ncbi:uncharacterized protein LOC132179041 [Corylus avellana]|uniref:uncharacterized protein LOC132179041 n=1 Tax=Corylus avellana TaxID=13451 RepID=UPI00286BB660|nr:uncharacterized protein LOC132179041 [Corylus avellana]
MWGQGQSCSLPLWNPQAVKLKAGIPFLVVPGLMRQRSVSVALAGNRDPRLRILPLPNWKSSSPSPSTASGSALSQTLSSALAPIQLLKLKAPGFRPSPQLGLLSLLFALSMAIGAIFSLAVISIPTINAFRRLAASMDKLSRVVSEEVPGTLSSLKLSGLEINELNLQLSNLRSRISGIQDPKKVRNNKPSSFGRRNYP